MNGNRHIHEMTSSDDCCQMGLPVHWQAIWTNIPWHMDEASETVKNNKFNPLVSIDKFDPLAVILEINMLTSINEFDTLASIDEFDPLTAILQINPLASDYLLTNRCMPIHEQEDICLSTIHIYEWATAHLCQTHLCSSTGSYPFITHANQWGEANSKEEEGSIRDWGYVR